MLRHGFEHLTFGEYFWPCVEHKYIHSYIVLVCFIVVVAVIVVVVCSSLYFLFLALQVLRPLNLRRPCVPMAL